MVSAPQKIYDSINNESDVIKLADERETETLYLDFKRIQNPKSPIPDDDCKKNLAKALSGFSNSAGGVLVFGIYAPSKGNYEKMPISELPTFRQEIEKLISRTTSRVVPGVVTKMIPADSDSLSGYLLVHIPESDEAPHMVLSEKKYYFRSGDSTLAMEHFQVEDAFGRRHRPKLQVAAKLSQKKRGQRAVVLEMVIKNHGRVAALYPMLRLLKLSEFHTSPYGIDGNRNFGLPQFTSKLSDFRGGINDLVHAGGDLSVVKLEASYPSSHPSTTFIEGEVAAQGCLLRRFRIDLPETALTTCLQETTDIQEFHERLETT